MPILFVLVAVIFGFTGFGAESEECRLSAVCLFVLAAISLGAAIYFAWYW